MYEKNTIWVFLALSHLAVWTKNIFLFFFNVFFTGPDLTHHCCAIPDSAQDPWTGLSWAHISWLLCMSIVTSFTSLVETCTMHVLHDKGRNESKKRTRVECLSGEVKRSLSRQWWPVVAVVPGGGPSSSLLWFFVFFSFSSVFDSFSLLLFFLSPPPLSFPSVLFFFVRLYIFFILRGDQKMGYKKGNDIFFFTNQFHTI